MSHEFTPYYFSAFKPFGYQRDCLQLLYNHDYRLNTPEILLSGSVGSAKSALLAHWVISHCLRWKGAAVGITRMSLPDLKKTLIKEILMSLENDPAFTEGIHYAHNKSSGEIVFRNKSHIIPVTFGDRDWGKTKSLLLSGLVIEEGTEMEDEFYIGDEAGFKVYKGRLRRCPGVAENFMIVATNPGDPDHFLYDYFIDGAKKYDSRHVFYSLTDANKYLDPVYLKQLRQDYSHLEAERYLRGQWISLKGKGVYAAYDPDVNYIDAPYEVDDSLPVRICFDFNIAANKPMSCCLAQYNPQDDTFHIFDEAVVDGSYTEDIMADIDGRGLLDFSKIIIHGDATGRSRTPASKMANYDVIKTYLEQKRIRFEIQVPRANPPIRERHRLVNAYCENALSQHRLFIYKKAKTAHLGMRTTRLKKGANFVEDDTAREQHITTAIGYGLYMAVNKAFRTSKKLEK